MADNKRGRKSKFEEIILPRIEEVKKWVSEGKTDKECANLLGITPKTFSKHKNSISSFNSVIKECRQPKVAELEVSMFSSALGFTKTVKKAMKIKSIEYENGKKVKETETIEPYEEEIYIPPNTTAQIFLLKNWGDYTNDPQIMALKEKEYKLKKAIAEANNFDLDVKEVNENE